MKRLLRLTTLTIGITLGIAVQAATITIINGDAPDRGLNDSTPVRVETINPGITRGAQRWFVYQAAANQWGSLLESSVEIRVLAQAQAVGADNSCSLTSPLLAAPYNAMSVADFDGSTIPGLGPLLPATGYDFPITLANALSGRDLTPGNPHIIAPFSARLDEGCAASSPGGWWYGLSSVDQAPDTTAFYPLLLEGFAKAFGFYSNVNQANGAWLTGVPPIFSAFLADESTSGHWSDMTNYQRLISIANDDLNLVWHGSETTLTSIRELHSGVPTLEVNAPASLAGHLQMKRAQFGPALPPSPGLRANLVLVDDGDSTGSSITAMGSVSDGCSAFRHPEKVRNKIALIDRGVCPYTEKVRNAQIAGAIGVVVAQSFTVFPIIAMGGDDPTITIPAVMISWSDAVALKAQLAMGTVNVTLVMNDDSPSGFLESGFMHMSVADGGSFTTDATLADGSPLLVQNRYPSRYTVDPITLSLLQDIGWHRNFPPANRAPVVTAPDAIYRSMSGDGAITGLTISDPDGDQSVLFVTLHMGQPPFFLPVANLHVDESRAINVKIFGNDRSDGMQLIGKARDIQALLDAGVIRFTALDSSSIPITLLNVGVNDAGGTDGIASLDTWTTILVVTR